MCNNMKADEDVAGGLRSTGKKRSSVDLTGSFFFDILPDSGGAFGNNFYQR
jgi:hypothetical protein